MDPAHSAAARRVAARLLALFAVTAATACAAAEGDPGWFELQMENDVFVKSRRATDQWYTNGIRATWSPSGGGRPWDAPLRSLLLGAVGAEDRAGLPYRWFAGQLMYTPRDIGDPAPQPDDRPWAGWLFLGRSYQGAGEVERFGTALPGHRLAEISLGIVGPSARAKESQTWVHRNLVDATIPQGWGNQLPDEPTVNLRWLETVKLGSSSVDTLVHWGFNAGNVQVFANAGATLRAGRNLCDFGVSTIMPADARPAELREPRAPDCAADAWRRPTWYASIRLDVRAVARNLFLDGSTFKDSPRVDRRRAVGDVTVGLTYRKHPWSVSYLYTRRSAEFRNQRGEPQRFGSVVISVPFF